MTAIQTIYPTIKAIPAKAFDWKAAFEAMRARYVASFNGKIPYCSEMAIAEDDAAAASGLHGKRDAIVHMAVSLASAASTRSHYQAPSEETLAWGGFLSGTNLVWTDAEAAEVVTEELLAFVNSFRKQSIDDKFNILRAALA